MNSNRNLLQAGLLAAGALLTAAAGISVATAAAEATPATPATPIPGGGQDASATAAMNELLGKNTQLGSISGKEFTDAVIKGTADLDNQAAGKEFADIKKFVRDHGDLLSPEAKAAFAVYEKAAQAAQAKFFGGGQHGAGASFLRSIATGRFPTMRERRVQP